MISKTRLSLLLSFNVVILLFFASYICGQGISNFPDERRTFKISTEKEVFLVGEPVLIKMTASIADSDKKPSFTDDLSVRIRSDDLISYEGALYPTREPSISLPAVPRHYTGKMVPYTRIAIIPNVESLFTTPNVYEVQLFLNAVEQIPSNKIRIKIVEPSRKDRKAFVSLRKYLDPVSYDWVCSGKDCVSHLEQFIDEFGGSVYGLHAKYQLANIYSIQGEFEKARQVFDALKGSTVTYYADEATERLREIETFIKNRQKSDQPPK